MVQGQDSNYRWGEEALGKDGPSGLVKKFDVLNPNMRARCMASRVRRGTTMDELTRTSGGLPRPSRDFNRPSFMGQPGPALG